MKKPASQNWAEFRLKVIGQLLACPPLERGELATALATLAAKDWCHPVTEKPVKFSTSTIERWYYRARKAGSNTTAALSRKRRSDAHGVQLDAGLAGKLKSQHKEHSNWSAKLHFDNLGAYARQKNLAAVMPSYQSVRRYMRAHGLFRIKKIRRGFTRDGEVRAHIAQSVREVRSYEVTHVGSLWHLDFHHARRPILTEGGEWVTPILFAVIDDYSRLIAHLQWYLTETTKDLVHGFSQALMRRGLPRALMSDNGAAMLSGEFTEGLARLGIMHETTLAYSPHQNGKMECFWGQVEGRLMAMLENKRDLGLLELNRLTHAWVEIDYHHLHHSETAQTPVARYMDGPSVMRPSLNTLYLKQAFTTQEERIQRRSDGTITLSGVRFEIPSRYRHLNKLCVRYARWDLSEVSLVSLQTNQIICTVYPLDKNRNADAKRRYVASVNGDDVISSEVKNDLPPYLKELVQRFDEGGFSAPFISQ